jgi:hypothetical protein
VAESTVRWFVVREKHCWMADDSADRAKRTGCLFSDYVVWFTFFTFFRIDLDRYGLACKMLNDVGTPFVGSMLYQLELLCHWYVLCSSDLDQFGSLYVVELKRLDGLSLV